MSLYFASMMLIEFDYMFRDMGLSIAVYLLIFGFIGLFLYSQHVFPRITKTFGYIVVVLTVLLLLISPLADIEDYINRRRVLN